MICLSLALAGSLQTSMASEGQSAEAALKKLLEDTLEAETFQKGTKGILVFPGIVKGGFIIEAHYGKGALRK